MPGRRVISSETADSGSTRTASTGPKKLTDSFLAQNRCRYAYSSPSSRRVFAFRVAGRGVAGAVGVEEPAAVTATSRLSGVAPFPADKAGAGTGLPVEVCRWSTRS
ncbi:hypothetical protein GCM10009677_04330 [Sphaerisporangium rubeum]